MDHHGWEYIVYSLVRIYEVSVWPGAILMATYLFRQPVRSGINAIVAKLDHLIEVRLTRTSASAKFKPPPHESITLPPLGIDDEKVP
jgi:hypothetical protein